MFRCLAFVLLVSVAAGGARSQPFGIDSRTTNTTLLIDDLPAALPGSMQLVRAWPQLAFSEPLFMAEAPDASGRFFVVEKGGRIKVFPKAGSPSPADVSVFLDLSSRTAVDSEQGALCIAFDPDFAQNGVFYVTYSWNGTVPGSTRLSRFVASPPNSNQVDPATEQVLLQLAKPTPTHNGGMIAFGPDGMLYMSTGDGADGGDPFHNAQDTSKLLGKMLRIDVRGAPDPGLAYRIPSDNPYVVSGPAGAQTRKEVWAYGLRNPWRFSFDRQNGRLLLGDVGEGQFEEVDVIQKGDNYGWNRMEGLHCFDTQRQNIPPPSCDMTGLTLPIAEYDHTLGAAVAGGYVYYGSAVPELYGMYLYADEVSGRVMGLRTDGQTVSGPYVLMPESNINPSGMGQTQDGEVYIADIGGGGLYVLRPAAPSAGGFPSHLSDIPALLAAGKGQDQTAEGIIPYAPNSPLWSDGALKERYLALPGMTQIGWKASGGWDFPEKGLVIKNFLVPMDERNPQASARRVETRLLYRRNGAWNGFSYEWNDAQTDAELLSDTKTKSYVIADKNGGALLINYTFPSRNQCRQCHTSAAGGLLGVSSPQMNHDFLYPASGTSANQLATFEHIGLFAAPLPDAPSNLASMPNPSDAKFTVRDRARSYLAANCSQCHRPGGGTPSSLDLRWETPDSAMHAIGFAPAAGDLGIAGGKIIYPHEPELSILIARDGRRGANQMPPLATARIDPAGLDIVTQYVRSLEPFNSVPEVDWMLYH